MSRSSGGRRPRRQFSEEFKEGAVRLVLDEGKTVGAVARELDLTSSALGGWVRQARAERTKGKSGLMKEELKELTRLRKEVRELRLERDLLKKSRPSSPKTSGSLRGDRSGEGPGTGSAALSAVRCVVERILRLAHPPGIKTDARRPTPQSVGPCFVHGRPRLRRQPAHPG
jgi:transposase